MANTEFSCWRCHKQLGEILLPLSRTEECPSCGADLHVCRMCRFYDRTVSDACREPIAETVANKERANFCGYLELSEKISGTDVTDPDAADELNALFSLDPDKGAHSASTADEARAALDDLFGQSDSNGKGDS